ncbi:ABC-2 transporter permease [Crassaminicella profunda]|uniref:ABC-2 transporter permease n=1 Tax=Crassaminicella profunda TaxID=1286698 RepID=UPI001CA63BDA|nr:ABC-2 transporter permease [Crassaminicella profunda]QZY55080.1 ABC-2 transporter permease [Crassaminicella profunda]
MFHLIMKDIRIQKKSFLFAIFYPIFAVSAFGAPDFSESIYIMMGVALTYIFALTAVTYDEKNKSEIFLLSLPIKKQHIIISKYLSIFVFCFISIVISGTIGAILNITGIFTSLRLINFIDIIAIFISMYLLMAIYYPLYFKFGTTYLKLVNIAFFMLVFFAPSTILKFLLENKDMPLIMDLINFINHTTPWQISLLIIFIVMLILILSFLVSLKIYKNKDF